MSIPNRGQGWDRRRRAQLLLGGLLALAAAPAVQAQQLAASGISQPVVQAVPGGGGAQLNAALSRLARDSRDVAALIDAGQASLELGDVQAAIGFYQRADAIAPGNGQVKGGLAAAYVQAEDPLKAIPLFEEAAKSGPLDPQRLAERALAYDLVGDAVTAQQFYRQALAARQDEETIRRLALSQAISGDKRGMEVTLAPLLQKQDKSSWRTRAFALAIIGQTEEAEAIARSTLPAEMAGAIAAYLRFMPRLTPAQQAAAANLGRFPRAADIGIDDPRFAQYARPRTVLASASQSLTPAGAPLGAKAESRQSRREREQAAKAAAKADKSKARPVQVAAAAPPEPKPGRETVVTPTSAASGTRSPVAGPPRVASPAPPASAPAKVAGELPPVQQQAAAPTPAPAPAPGFGSLDGGAPRTVSGFDLRQVPAAPASQPVPAAAPPPQPPVAAQASVPAAVPPPPPVKAAPPPAVRPAPSKPAAPAPRPRQLEDVFADLTPPSRQAEAAAGAVDVRRIKPVRIEAAESAAKACEPAPDPKARGAKAAPKGKQPAVRTAKGAAATQCVDVKKPVTPSHPSRIWVQVATGRDRKALAFDWRRMVREDAAVFGGRKGFTSAWGQTNRLLTGPFETEAAANAFIGRLKKAGVNGSFLWTSPAGQVVDAVAAGN